MNNESLPMKNQIEMTFEARCNARPAIQRGRQARAQWWFNRMRAVVDKAIDWRPLPPARPEQTYLSIARER